MKKKNKKLHQQLNIRYWQHLKSCKPLRLAKEKFQKNIQKGPKSTAYSIRLENLPWLQRDLNNKVNIF